MESLKQTAQRKPRFFIVLAVGALVFMLYVASQDSTSLTIRRLPGGGVALRNEDLAIRLHMAEENFQRSLKKRKALIKQFGPTPDKVKSYPVNRDYYTLWDFFTPSFQCPHAVERIGINADGGKYVCGLHRIADKPDCVIYSFGINGESSFEAELLERTSGCQVWGYDFSVQSFGPEVAKNRKIAYRSHFQAWGLAGSSNHGPGQNPPMYTLPELMELNGHTFIDVLKIDIEGYEFSTLTDLLKAYAGQPLPFGQLQVEIHAWIHDWQDKFPEFLGWWEALEKAGLRAFWTEASLMHSRCRMIADLVVP
ncbi:hypothetical protein FRC07_013797 [Ceratobasidium sp. 392]|nr:hypothetical protein FRC07_013797 [Ceratobasidium sp. 392]